MTNINLHGFFLLITCLTVALISSGCVNQEIHSQSAEDLLLFTDDLPPGWQVYLDEPKQFSEWPTDDRIKAQQRGYVDGHQRTFVNGSEGIITVANSIYANADMEELYNEALEPYANKHRINNGLNETLKRLPNLSVGQYDFVYEVTIPNEKMNFSYYEFFFIESNVMNHMRCVVQKVNMDDPFEFCISLLNNTDMMILDELHAPSKPVLRDTLITVPVAEFLPEKSELPFGWGIISEKDVEPASIPSDMVEQAGPGQLLEAHAQTIMNDTRNRINIVNSLYANVVDEHTFQGDDEDLMQFTRLTMLDPTLPMKAIEGPKISKYTWWVNITREDDSSYINVFFGAKNMMVEVICDVQPYEESFRLCDRMARIIYDKIPNPSTSYTAKTKPSAEPVIPTDELPQYDSSVILSKANEYLTNQYNLPNGSVGEATLSEYNGTLLHIKHPDFDIEFLLIKVNTLKEIYGDLSLDEIIRQDCENDAEMLGIPYETCMERAPGIYNELYFPVYLCPLNMTPSEVTGTVGPWGNCNMISDKNIGPQSQDLIKELGSGYRYRYARNVLGLDPFSSEADKIVEEFMLKLMLADWIRSPMPVIEVKFDISMGGLGCYPYAIRVYFDETLETITSNEETICVD